MTRCRKADVVSVQLPRSAAPAEAKLGLGESILDVLLDSLNDHMG
jgi:hypothetical protein